MHTTVETLHLDDIKYSGKLVSKFILSIDSETGGYHVVKRIDRVKWSIWRERSKRIYQTNAKDYSDDIKVILWEFDLCKKGNNAKHKLMISAHMDEVGLW